LAIAHRLGERWNPSSPLYPSERWDPAPLLSAAAEFKSNSNSSCGHRQVKPRAFALRASDFVLAKVTKTVGS
jgi:hypothetical protein